MSAARDDGWHLSEADARLRPNDGVVTAGNASTLSDGAAMLVIASPEVASSGVQPLARILASATAGTAASRPVLGADRRDPNALMQSSQLFTLVKSICLKSTKHLRRECSGACAGLDLSADKVNISGGAIALGHPIGAASGREVLVTLLHALRRTQQTGWAWRRFAWAAAMLWRWWSSGWIDLSRKRKGVNFVPIRDARQSSGRTFAPTKRLNACTLEEDKIKLGGGADAIRRQHEKGRMTARERIAAAA